MTSYLPNIDLSAMLIALKMGAMSWISQSSVQSGAGWSLQVFLSPGPQRSQIWTGPEKLSSTQLFIITILLVGILAALIVSLVQDKF